MQVSSKKNFFGASPIFWVTKWQNFAPKKKTLSNKGIRGKAKRMGNFFITCSLLNSPDVFLWGWEVGFKGGFKGFFGIGVSRFLKF